MAKLILTTEEVIAQCRRKYAKRYGYNPDMRRLPVINQEDGLMTLEWYNELGYPIAQFTVNNHIIRLKRK